jgi:hypothetical protein
VPVALRVVAVAVLASEYRKRSIWRPAPIRSLSARVVLAVLHYRLPRLDVQVKPRASSVFCRHRVAVAVEYLVV